MRKEKFKDIFWFAPKSRVKAGDSLEKGRFPFYTSSQNLSKWIDTEQYFDEALIFGTGGSPSIHYVDEPFSTSTDCIVTINRIDDIKTKFVYYYLSSNIQILEEGFKGAGLKHISKNYIENIEIPIPELEIQNKVIAILDKAKSLLEKRQSSINLFDELKRSTFSDMFGDSFLNNKKWEKLSLKKISTNIIDCPHSTPEYLEVKSEYPCIRTSEIKNGEILWDSMKYISAASHITRIARLEPRENDIIFGREGSVGDAAIIPPNLNISLGQRVMLFRADENLINPVFFWSQLLSDGTQFMISKKVIGATVKRINIKDLIEIEFIVPPLELQNLFARMILKLIKLKNKLRESEKNIQILIDATSQLAFKGELDFNTAVDLEVLLENDFTFFKENSNTKSIQLLLERLDKDELNEKKFSEQEIYDKAKGFVFELLKEGKVKQVFDEKTKRVKLTV